MNDPAHALAVIAAWRPETICADLALTETARACLAEAASAPAWLAALLRAGCHRDAVSFLAHALPRPQAVHWACDCVEAGGIASASTAAEGAVAAARAWAREPGEGHRQGAAAAADAVVGEQEGGARFAAFAAAWSGESLAPAGQPVVAPAKGLGAAAVAAAVLLAATAGPAGAMRERLDDFIGRGVLCAGGHS